MSAVLLAVFNDYEAAERVRVDLVRDGFPTDRVELTASCEPGRAGLEPAPTLRDRFVQYFCTLLRGEDDRRYAQLLAERVEGGAATITVHPRGMVETERAAEILEHAGPVELAERDLANQTFEHAAGKHEGAWIRNLWVDSKSESHCIYCRLFGSDSGATS